MQYGCAAGHSGHWGCSTRSAILRQFRREKYNEVASGQQDAVRVGYGLAQVAGVDEHVRRRNHLIGGGWRGYSSASTGSTVKAVVDVVARSLLDHLGGDIHRQSKSHRPPQAILAQQPGTAAQVSER